MVKDYPQNFLKLVPQSVGCCGIIHGGLFFGIVTPYYMGFLKRKPFSFQYCIIHWKTNDVPQNTATSWQRERELPVFDAF